MMKASFRLIFAALSATAALVGCTKEITPNFENDKVNPEGSRIITVSFAPQTKTTLDGFQPKFANKDSILISNGEALDTCEVKVDDKTKVATITTNLTGPLTAVYPYKAAKMNESNLNQIDTILVSTVQSGKFADANICMARMTSENDESLSFDNKTAVFCIYPPAGKDAQYVEVSAEGFVIANNIPTESAITDSSTIHVNTTTADSVYVSILVPEGLTVGSLSFSDGTNVKTIKDERASTAIAAGALYTVTNENWKSPEADIPEPLEGVFSVSTTKKVHFSKGNLYADGSYALHFEDAQWKSTPASAGSKDASHVSHFTWSDNITTAVSDSNSGDNLFCDESHKVSVDGGDAIYYALSKDEWTYLFNNHTMGWASVNGKTGYVIAPDGFTGNLESSYADDAALASAGNLVFLPAAGGCFGSNVSDVGIGGYYWSSTAYDGYAYYVFFISSDVYPDYDYDRYNGSSVRLVTDVSAAPTPTEPDYVEIGGKKWATKNLGATEVATDYRCYGDYYQWGSVEKLYTSITWTGNTTGSFVGLKTDGFAETNLTYKDNADLSDATNDVVKKTYPGTGWRMPTKDDFQNLYDACVDGTYNKNKYKTDACGESTTIDQKGVYWCGNYDGVAGVLFYDGTSRLFFPAAGYGDGTGLSNAGSYGYYWSSSLNTSYPSYAYGLRFYSYGVYPQNGYSRYYGYSVRPVSDMPDDPSEPSDPEEEASATEMTEEVLF